MPRLLPLAGLLLLVLGCSSKPLVTERQPPQRSTVSGPAYFQYVEQRVAELQRMGGPFADKTKAREKALRDADARFGPPPADFATTWAWGPEAEKVRAQADFNAELDKMQRARK